MFRSIAAKNAEFTMLKRRLCLVLVFFTLCGVLLAHENLPSGYAKIRLGMSVEEVKKLLRENPAFGYHGDRDVSLLPGENRVLIETDAFAGHVDSFLDRCWFQFYEDKLYIIIINLNRAKIDHYSVFTALCKKYGDPSTLNPERSLWENDKISMSLERPLSLKYVDKAVFEKLSGKSRVEQTVPELTQEWFLDSL